MNKKEAIEIIKGIYSGTQTTLLEEMNEFGREKILLADCEALEKAIASMEKLMEYEKLEATGKLIRMPDCRKCKHAYRDDTRCYECLANMTCWPNNFEPRKKVKK